MRLPANDRELAEILVEGHQDARLAMRVLENLFIARIGRPVTRPYDVMPGLHQIIADVLRDAGVEKEPQAALPPSAGSTRSCPTGRRA